MAKTTSYKKATVQTAPDKTSDAKTEAAAKPAAASKPSSGKSVVKYEMITRRGPVYGRFGKKFSTVTEAQIRSVNLSPEGCIKAGLIREVGK